MSKTKVLAIAMACLVGGCQSYDPLPLDLREHHRAAVERDVAEATVADYAQRLSSANADSVATPFDPHDGLSLTEAEAVALVFNARLRVARLRARVPAVGAEHAGRWSDPALTVDVERILSSVPHPWVVSGMLNFTIPISGSLGAEKRRALAEAGAEARRVYEQEVMLLDELRRAWLAWSALEQRVELTRRYVEDLDGVSRTAEGLRKAGELSRLDARLIRLDNHSRRDELRSLEAQRVEAVLTIKSLMGLLPEAPVELRSTLAVLSVELSTKEQGGQRLEANNPRLLLAKSEYEVAERKLFAEIRKQFPDLTIGAGYGEDEGQSRIPFGGSIPIPMLNANRRGIAEARASRDASKAQVEAVYEELLSEAARAETRLTSARERREHLEREVVPLVDEQVAEARNLGRVGDATTLILLDGLARGYEAKLQVLNAVLEEATAAVRLRALFAPGLAFEMPEKKP